MIRALSKTDRWQIPIVLPALLALVLVVGLAVQSGRAVQVHRRAVALALRDYAAFATWQYTRRASDYLRLTIITTLSDQALAPGQSRLRAEAFVSGAVHDNRVQLDQPDKLSTTHDIDDAFARALAQSDRSRVRFGLTWFGDPKQHRYLGYAFRNDSTGRPISAQGIILNERDLIPIFDHVASFAPLLPPTFVGHLPNDSLVSVKIVGADGALITVIGRDRTDGITANDVLGPDLADVRVVATLNPIATRRLVAGGMPSSNTPALIAMLAVTLVLCAVAVNQMRRTAALIRLRDDFVESVSHELKTPLTQISLFADTLALPRERSHDEQRQYLTIISREATRLGQLVDGILHFAGMTRSTDTTTARESSLLGEEIRAAVAAFEPIAEARSVVIQTRIDGEIEIDLDRDAFRQLMLNLLDNALKFGPECGRIVITVFGGERRATIWVDDDGPGVPESDRERIFEAFARAESSAGKTGSGIGLAVVRGVVQRHGGLVRMIESPSGGARVEVQLPAARVITREFQSSPA
jgi:signal transduction histidine kinase